MPQSCRFSVKNNKNKRLFFVTLILVFAVVFVLLLPVQNNKNNECKCESPISVGGQALIEGIMMMGPKGAAMSVRLPDGTIDTEKLEVKHLRKYMFQLTSQIQDHVFLNKE